MNKVDVMKIIENEANIFDLTKEDVFNFLKEYGITFDKMAKREILNEERISNLVTVVYLGLMEAKNKR